MSADDLKPFVAQLATGVPLTRREAERAFTVIMDGRATPSQIGAFLMGLRVRGETVDEIAGAVSVMREKMARVTAPDDAFDIVGTGGDGSGTYNVSTCAAFVLAGTGLPVAKHGNRALSSRSGAAVDGMNPSRLSTRSCPYPSVVGSSPTSSKPATSATSAIRTLA